MCDVLGARLTLSQDMKRAQTWVTDKMEEIGLINISIEPFMEYGVTWEGAVVLTTPPAVIDLEALARATPRRTPEELKQMAEDVIPNRPRGRGDAAAPNPDILNAEEKIAFYKAEGVLALLECRSGRPGAVRGFARPGTKQDNWSREGSLNSLPIIAVTPEHYNRMYRICERGIPVKVELEVRNRLGEQVEMACNVIGEIPGTDLQDEVVMIGAHFDTWHASPNASDNTSGCAVALEAARILKAVGARPRRTIRIALWAGEEQGIHGSREYVYKHFGNPNDPEIGIKPEYEKFSVYFNQDYGAGAFRGIYLQGNEYARRIFNAWMEPLKDLGFTAISIQSVGSTDHVPFNAVGLPGFQFLQDRIPGTAGHTNLDFLDTLQEDDLMKNAVIMAVFAYHAAMSDERIPRKKE